MTLERCKNGQKKGKDLETLRSERATHKRRGKEPACLCGGKEHGENAEMFGNTKAGEDHERAKNGGTNGGTGEKHGRKKTNEFVPEPPAPKKQKTKERIVPGKVKVDPVKGGGTSAG